MALGEAFTAVAVFEAVDKISRVVERMNASLDGFSATAARTAEATAAAGETINASLLQTASGADAVELADAKLEGAQARLAATTKAQADAERALLDAQAAAAGAADGDAAATERLGAASAALADAQKKTALAAKEVSAAEQYQADVARATALATEEGRAAADAAAAAQEKQALTQKQAAAASEAVQKGMKLAALGVAAVGYESVKAAGNFESMTEHLVTDAGESQQNIAMIRSGMLQLATTTGTTTDQMAAGMYHIESAGFHGAQALEVLKTAAEGAKVGGADLDTIGQALTGTMNAFGPSAGTATQVMNGMIAAVGAGDMKMEAFGSALGNVAAIGASAGLSFAQVAGGVATMTAQNVSAQRATQDLAHTISSLSNPSKIQMTEMAAMGVNANDLAQNLGKRGLTGTFDVLVQAIAAHTQGGQVFVQALDKSKVAAQQAQQALSQMPDAMKKVAESWAAGATSTKDFDKEIQKLPPAQQALYTQFEALTKKSGSFTDALKANNPTAQTFNAALAKMVGGSTGLNTVLMLTGQHAAAFQQNVDTIGAAAHKSGSEVDNWKAIQQTFNQKMDVAKASVEAAGISIGTVLLPVVSKIASVITAVVGPMASWIASHQKWVGLAVAVAGGIGLMVAAMKAWEVVQAVINGLTAIFAAEETAILGPIELVVIAIAALAAGLYYAWNHFTTFRVVTLAVVNAVKVAFIDVWHALEAAWRGIASGAVWLGHELQSIWNSIVGGVMALWHGIEGAWNAIWGVTSAVWGAISGFFEKWWPLLFVLFATPIAVIVGIWNHWHKEIEDTTKTVWGAIAGFFEATWDLIATAAGYVWEYIKLTIITPIEDVWHAIVYVWGYISAFLGTEWAAISTAASWIWQQIKTFILKPLGEVADTVGGIISKVGTTIWNGFNDAWKAVSDVGSWFVGLGSDIVNGIVSGVSSAAHFLTDKVKNLANDALSSAKSFLGISSPSKEFADQVGQWIPHGIAQGVSDHASVAQKAVQQMAGSLSLGSPGGLSYGGAAGAGLAYGGGLTYAPSAGGATVIHQTIDLRNASVMGNQAMDQLAQKIGQQIPGHLAAGGVRIRM